MAERSPSGSIEVSLYHRRHRSIRSTGLYVTDKRVDSPVPSFYFEATKMVGLERISTRGRYFTKARLIAANEESIKSGRNRNLIPEAIAKLPDDLRFPISMAFIHNGKEIRCVVLLANKRRPKPNEVHTVFLDIPAKTFNALPNIRKLDHALAKA